MGKCDGYIERYVLADCLRCIVSTRDHNQHQRGRVMELSAQVIAIIYSLWIWDTMQKQKTAFKKWSIPVYAIIGMILSDWLKGKIVF